MRKDYCKNCPRVIVDTGLGWRHRNMRQNDPTVRRFCNRPEPRSEAMTHWGCTCRSLHNECVAFPCSCEGHIKVRE